ncbi:hypothetical protein B484DRAFT_331577 [Ochromonadaceae sp. CCMP2298]|nr:hypothetical protein B484DRAFT_331577 [Ochromonadaceae sp. CCMP2298]
MKTKAAEKLCDKGCYTIQGRDRFTYGTGPSPIKARLRDGTYGTLMEKADAVNSLFVLYMHSDERVAGGIEPLKALLRDGTLMGKAHAAIALLMLSPEREADAGVEAVVALLRDGPPEVRVAAAKALRYFCVNADARVEIVAAGGVEALTALLRDGSPAGKWMAARALERLTQTPETR